MQLIAKKSFPYGGTRINPGDPFNASKKDAALLVHVKYAEYPGEEVKSQEKPQEKKQDYKRRDMVAEESSKPKKEAKKPAKKREYKRRDMKADD